MDLHRKLLIILISVLCPLTSVFGQTGSINVDENHNGHKIFGLPTPAANNEAATKKYVDDHAGGGGGAAAWGSITGTLSAQTDLQTALDAKQPLDGDLTALAALSGTHNIYYRSAANTWSAVTIGSGLDFTGATLSATGGGAITPAALTKTDDTNVTLTLGGTPATALLQATSLTLGWTGTLAVSRGGTGAATAGAHNYFGNNTAGTAAPGFHQIDYSELSGTPTVPTDISGAHFLTTQAESGLSAEFNLGGLTTGILKQTVSAGVSTPAIATSGTDYAPATSGTSILKGNAGGFSNAVSADVVGLFTGCSGTQYLGADGACHIASGGSGTVTNIATTSPITGGPITSTGIIALDVSVDHAFTAAQTVTLNNATTNAVDNILTLGHNSTGTPAGGLGTGLLFQIEDSNTVNQNAGQIAVAWAIPTSGSRRSYMDFQLAPGSNILSSMMRLFGESGNGSLSVGSTTDPGTNGIINANTGFWVGNAASTSGKILQSNGSYFTASTPIWPTTAGTAGYTVRSDGTNITSYPQDMLNSNTAAQGSISTSDVYIAGSSVVVAAGDFKAKGQYHCIFDMAKTAGTGAIVISLRIGTAGTTSDAQIQTYTFAAGTSVADTATFEIFAVFRSVGSGTSAVVQGICRGQHNLATTGMFSNTTESTMVIGSPSPSSGFNSSTATTIGVSFNGSTAFAGSSTLVQAQLIQ